MNKTTIKNCKKHGEAEYVLESSEYYRCKKCRSEAVQRRRDSIKIKAINYKGGKCEKCGYSKCLQALDFHHSGDKDFGIAQKGYTRSWEKVKAEIDKCILLCANCHREIHSDPQ